MPRSNPNFKRCPRCNIEAVTAGEIETLFGYRTTAGVQRPQSYCRTCRASHTPAAPGPTVDTAEGQAVAHMLDRANRANATTQAYEQGRAAESSPPLRPWVRREFLQAMTTPAGRAAHRVAPAPTVQSIMDDTTGQFLDPLAPPVIDWNNLIPVSTNPLTTFTHIDRVSIELEGGFTRELPAHCCHTHNDNCRRQACAHRHDSQCQRYGPERCRCCIAGRMATCYAQCQHVCEGPCVTPCNHNCRTDNSRGSRLMCVGGYHGDGSVHSVEGTSGEVSCPVPCTNMAELLQYVTEYHPDSVNSSCGTHFHVSVKNHAVNYDLLAERGFYDLFMHRLDNWVRENVTTRSIRERIKSRIEGTNRFCRKSWQGMYMPEQQRRQRSKGDCRYSHLNYCENITDSVSGVARRTLEVRVFHGMKTPAVIMSAAECLFRCVEDWLAYRHAQIAANAAERDLAAII